ncbi:MAG: hypothetical protein IJP86_01585 [Synergistaceae bacterium]|nr:hypothetical protein [Synergistaceae bacterium]
MFYLFFEIDPDHVIDEIHEDRRDASGKNLIDPGANNRGFIQIGVTGSANPPFDRDNVEQIHRPGSDDVKSGLFAAAMDFDASVFPYVEWVKVNGLDFADFIAQEVDGQTYPVNAEIEVKFAGDKVMTDAAIIGYKLKPEAKGKAPVEITEDDFGGVIVKEHFFMLPGEDHKLHFRISPKYLADGVGFVLNVYGIDYPLTEIVYGSDNAHGVGSSSSGGCSAGRGVMAGICVLGLAVIKRH